MNEEAYEALKTACENFVNKVDAGKARSKQSYMEMKNALNLINNNCDKSNVIGRSELLRDFSDYLETEWACPEINDDVIAEYKP